MAFNNGYPFTYPQMYPQTPQMPSQGNLNQGNGIIWVQGEAGAKAYPVGAGNTVLMMDSESETFYIKTTAPNGMPQPLKIYDYKERAAMPTVNNNNFITREEFEKRLAELKEVEENAKPTI